MLRTNPERKKRNFDQTLIEKKTEITSENL